MMDVDGQVEILTRGVCVIDGQLLMCHTKGADNMYLPGGHLDFMEKASDALVREIDEELGLHAIVGTFLGAVEHTFMQREERHCEINLVFILEIEGVDVSKTPESKEEHIEFFWHDMKDIKNSRLEPSVIRDTLECWINNDEENARWLSTYA